MFWSVSPPTREAPTRLCSAPSPEAKRLEPRRVGLRRKCQGEQIDVRAGRLWRRGPKGSPRSALWPMLPAGSSFRKCTPSTIVSQVSTISWPSGGRSTAASSRSDERGHVGRERRKVAGDDVELANAVLTGVAAILNHRAARRRRTRAAAPYGRACPGCHSPPWARRRRKTHGRCRHIRR